MVFIMAADEQTTLSGGSPIADKVSLQDLIVNGSDKNNHIELTGFYFGKQYIYATKLVQFNEVYVPMFAAGKQENGSNLNLLLWIRNDRNSNQPLIQSERELDRFVSEYNQHPGSVTGVLRKPLARVRDLTLQSYPGTKPESLRVLWAREFPTQASANLLWTICSACVLAAGVCAVAYKRSASTLRS